MQEAYCRVIDMIDAGTINHRAVSMALAKLRPDVFLAIHDVVDGAGASQEVQMDRRLLEMMEGGKVVEAIKLHRSLTGFGLKESKDYCEALLARGTPNVEPSTAGVSIATLKASLDDLLGKLDVAGGIRTEDGGEFR